MKYIDLTHTFITTMPVFPGDSLPSLQQTKGLSNGGIVDHEITTGMHVGTHMDAPAHMIEGGKLLSDYEPDKFFGRGVLVEAFNKPIVGLESLIGVKIKEGDIVLINTGFYKKYGQQEYFNNYPVISAELAAELISAGVKAVGTDTPSPDIAPYHIHKKLLPEDILIIENLTNLDELLNVKKFEVIALPAKFETNAAPCRVVAKIL